jgi:hypothetical protein
MKRKPVQVEQGGKIHLVDASSAPDNATVGDIIGADPSEAVLSGPLNLRLLAELFEDAKAADGSEAPTAHTDGSEARAAPAAAEPPEIKNVSAKETTIKRTGDRFHCTLLLSGSGQRIANLDDMKHLRQLEIGVDGSDKRYIVSVDKKDPLVTVRVSSADAWEHVYILPCDDSGTSAGEVLTGPDGSTLKDGDIVFRVGEGSKSPLPT